MNSIKRNIKFVEYLRKCDVIDKRIWFYLTTSQIVGHQTKLDIFIVNENLDELGFQNHHMPSFDKLKLIFLTNNLYLDIKDLSKIWIR